MNVPSRASDLSPEEEDVRCELTWHNFDERLWIAGCAEQKELEDWVADAAKFIQDREDTWVVFSDQIPLWVKIGMHKTVFASWESRMQTPAKKLARKGMRRDTRLHRDWRM